MSISLGGVVLNPQMQWPDRKHSFGVAQTAKRTLGGGLVVFAQKLQRGLPVTLMSTDEQGWLTLAVVSQIEAMAAVPGNIVSFEYGTFSASVIFRHNDSPPAVDMNPLIPRQNPSADDFYIGQIKLLTV